MSVPLVASLVSAGTVPVLSYAATGATGRCGWPYAAGDISGPCRSPGLVAFGLKLLGDLYEAVRAAGMAGITNRLLDRAPRDAVDGSGESEGCDGRKGRRR